jgi:Initiator Replication protein
MDFQSSYTVRIYEHLKQYESIGRRKMDIEYIRKTFDLGTKYPLFANFYQRIIAPAHRDINAHSDLMITEIERIKESGKITSLVFKFYRKDTKIEEKIQEKAEILEETTFEYIPKTVLPSIEVKENVPQKADISVKPSVKVPDPTDPLYTEFEPDVIKSFGVTPFVLAQLIQNYDADLIRKQIRITKRKRGASPTSNIAGFFVNAVKTDYNDPVEAKEAQKQARQAENEAIRRAAEKKQQTLDAIADITNMINTGVNTTIRKLVANDPTITARAIEYATERIITDRTLFNAFRQKGYDFEKLDLETWRNEVFLRNQVIEAMQKLEPKSFLYLSSLRAELEELSLP